MRPRNSTEKAYDAIRNNDGVSTIAKNTGMKDFSIQRIKNHLFYNTHKLDDGIRKLDADPRIVNAWNRLEKGTHTNAGLKILNHKLFKSKFEGTFRTDYRTAHEAANKVRRPSCLE